MNDIGLVLEGGAFRGIFTAGILDYLLEKEVQFPYVIGVSAGACNMLGFLSKQKAYAKRSLIQEEPSDRFYGLNQMAKSHKLVNLDRLCLEYPYNQNPFDFDTFFQTPSIGEVVVTNCDTGEAEYLEERSSRERLLLMTKASSSILLLTSMVEIDHKRYLDGGLSDSVPLLRAIDRGFKKNVIVMTKNKGDTETLNKHELAFCEMHYRRFPSLVKTLKDRNDMYRKTLAIIEEHEKNGDVFVIRPEVPKIHTFETDEEKLVNIYDHGYEVMGRYYNQLLDFMQA